MLARSPGISVFLRHAPLAYSSKSSPGFTDLSMPARSMPMVGAALAVVLAGAGGVPALSDGDCALQPTIRAVVRIQPMRCCMGRVSRRWGAIMAPEGRGGA